MQCNGVLSLKIRYHALLFPLLRLLQQMREAEENAATLWKHQF